MPAGGCGPGVEALRRPGLLGRRGGCGHRIARRATAVAEGLAWRLWPQRRKAEAKGRGAG